MSPWMSSQSKTPDLIASEMNRYFVKVAGDLQARLLEDNSNRLRSFTFSPEVDRSVYARPTDDCEISQILHTINLKSAMGVDHISVRFLRSLGDTFVQAMTRATNESLKYESFVNLFKIARLTPLFKGSSHSLYGNYRPVSVIPNLAKIRFEDFSHQNNLIYRCPFGVQKGSSSSSKS